MSQARYVGSWGFDVHLSKLYDAAFAWRSVKLFRLIRLRQKSTIQPDRPSLASLPPEVLLIIENEVLKEGLKDAFRSTPTDDCVCKDLWEGFQHEPEVAEAFEDYCEGQDIDIEAIPQQELWAQFERTETYSRLIDAHFDAHIEEGCDGMNAGREFWRELLDSCSWGSTQGDAKMLHDFLFYHHMEMPRFKHPMDDYLDGPLFDYFDDPFAEYENEPIRLELCPTKCWYASKPSSVMPGPFVVNKPKLFAKLRLYGIMPQGVKQKGATSVTVPLKWSLRRCKGDPVDLSGKRILVENNVGEEADRGEDGTDG